MKIKFIQDGNALLPTRGHKADAGLDLLSTIDTVVPKHGSVAIDTGIHFDIPRHFVGILKSKSGLNVKYGIQSTGVIDSGYTGSVVVNLVNHSDNDYQVKRGDKITQILFLHIPEIEIVPVDKFAETDRGNNGFGSTGR